MTMVLIKVSGYASLRKISVLEPFPFSVLRSHVIISVNSVTGNQSNYGSVQKGSNINGLKEREKVEDLLAQQEKDILKQV
ncbi:hypothetical protein D3Z58_13695 [Clostridiaceae bacterium]|nr:hypothetical protein [Clostridiaceae bacterium]